MTTLTPTEAAILEQLREKPMRFSDLNLRDESFLNARGYMRFSVFAPEWRTKGRIAICHLTHEGRLALIAWEKKRNI